MKNIGLVTVSLILSILIGTVLGRGQDTDEDVSSKKIVIGFSMDTLKEARWQRDKVFFEAAIEELGAECKILSANSNDTIQMQDVQSLITNKVDVIVIAPHNGSVMGKAVQLAHEAGIPVIAYDRMINDCNLDLYISFDNVKVGEIQAQYMVDHLPIPGHGKIIRIFGAKTDNNALLFKKGQDNILKPYIERGDIEIIHEDWAENWKPENAKKIANAAITKYGASFDAVLASNDGTAMGAIQSLKEADMAGKVLVTGQDSELVACQRIVSGQQSMTIYKPLKAVAETAAQSAVALAQGQVLIARQSVDNGTLAVPSILLHVIAVDKDNMRETVVKEGFHSEDAIYGQ